MHIQSRSDYLLNGGIGRVQGWLMPGAAWATWLLADWQAEQGIAGHVAEIGVHHGKYFMLLALLRRPAELAFAIDVFDLQEFNVDGSGLGDLRIFEENLKIHLPDPSRHEVRIIRADSLSLADKDITTGEPFVRPGTPQGPPAKPSSSKRVPPAPTAGKTGRAGSCRIFSVDGCHTAQHTANDIRVAMNNLAPGGFIVVDDFYNAEWPGVQEGVHALLSQTPQIKPIAYGDNKLYLVDAVDHPRMFDAFVATVVPVAAKLKHVELHGTKVVYVETNDLARLYRASMDRREAKGVFGKSGLVSCDLGTGWGTPESAGLWMTADTAEVVVTCRPEILHAMGEVVTVSIDVYPFLSPKHPTRTLALHGDGQVVSAVLGRAGVSIELAVPKSALAAGLSLAFFGGETERVREVVPSSTDDRAVSVWVSQIRVSG